jgi:hypothetical protein
MIIIQTASKDTFVTDMSTQNNKGVDANFGQASTLDLFKIVGENKNVKSRAMLAIDIASLVDGDTFTITDYSGISNTFEFDNESNIINGNISFFDPLGNETVIDNLVTRINVDAGVKITAYKLDSDKILLQQNASGDAGDTIPVVSQVDNNNTRITITPFRRFEHSAALLTFDLKSIVDEHINTLDDSIFSTTDPAADFKAFLKLKDVGVASTSPKDFKLRLRVLSNDFNEGIGRDVLHFSDLGDANFKTINSLTSPSVTWTNEGIVSVGDVYTTSSLDAEVEVKTGEDIVFDITNHVYAFMEDTRDNPENVTLSQTFVIDIAHENLFDEFTYFVKRFGSRNLSNKFNRPKVEIKVKDEKFENISYSTKKRFLNNDETFYLTNLVNKKLQDFPETTKLVLNYEDDTISSTNLRFLRVPSNNCYISITDAAGLTKTYGFLEGGGDIGAGANPDVDATRVVNTTNDDDVSSVLSAFKTLIDGVDGHNGTITASISNDTINIVQDDAALQQTSFVTKTNDSNTSIIIKETKTKFNLFSSTINESNVNDYKGNTLLGIKKFSIPSTLISRFNSSTQFQADLENNKKVKINFKYFMTSGGSDFLVKNEDVEFHLPETSEVDLYKKLRVVLNTQQKQIIADDGVKTLQFSFIDLAKQYDSVKTPIELTSEDLGEVTYSMYDVDTGVYLLKNDPDFGDTSMFYNGKHYIANFYASKVFKNVRVSFDFEYTDPLSGLKKKISDKKLIVRFE